MFLFCFYFLDEYILNVTCIIRLFCNVHANLRTQVAVFIQQRQQQQQQRYIQ